MDDMSLEQLLEKAKENQKAEIEKRRIKEQVAQKEKFTSDVVARYYELNKSTLQSFVVPFPQFTHEQSRGGISIEKGANYKLDDSPRNSSAFIRVTKDKLTVHYSLAVKKSSIRYDEDRYERTETMLSTLPFNATEGEIIEQFEKAVEVAIKECLDL
jgi:hypothetical protein